MPTLRSSPPEGEQDPSGAAPPTLKVAAVARRLGVAPATLRTWARRYGLGPSAHLAGSHRQYSAADLTRLVVMRRLTLEGVAPAEAARIAVATLVAEVPGRVDAVVTSLGHADFGTDAFDAVVDGEWDADEAAAADDAAHFGRAGGGHVVAMPTAGPASRGLARAALALDDAACRRILVASLRRGGVVTMWEDLARPVLHAIGQRWAATDAGIDAEHLFSESVLTVIRSMADTVPARSAATVLLACAEFEEHSLPMHVLGAALHERGVTARVLGSRVPREALADAARRTGPVAVLVYAALQVPDASVLADLPGQRPAPRLFVGGEGWADVALPSGTTRVGGLADAVDRVAAAALP